MKQNDDQGVKVKLPPKKASKYMFYSLISIIQISITFLFCQSYVDKTNGYLIDYIEQEMAKKPNVRVLNLKKLTENLMAKGLSPAETAEYGDLYIQTLSEQRYLVLDSSPIIAYKDGLNIPLPEFSDVKKVAESLGIQPKENYQKLLNNTTLGQIYDKLNVKENNNNAY